MAGRNVHVTANGRNAVVEVREPVAAVHVVDVVDVEPDPVVAYLEGDASGVRPDADGHRGANAGVLGRVLDGFQAAEVDGRLDRRREAIWQSGLDADRQWRTAGNRGQGGGETVIDEHGGVHAVGEAA
jgi:hypothetical protein